MVDIDSATKRVDPGKVYNISELRRDNLFPWLSPMNQISYTNAVHEDMTGDNLMRAKATGSGRGREYKIKGINVIKYLTKKNHERNKRTDS